MKTRWLSRTLVQGPSLCLCLSEKEYHAAEKRADWPVDDDLWCHPASARVHMRFDCEDPVAIVCLDIDPANIVAVAGCLAHEATHIWQDWLLSMGEAAPGDEISAYAVQNLVVLLMDEWVRRTS
jgi:hypothetical protein